MTVFFPSSKLHITCELFIYLPIPGSLKCAFSRAYWAQVQNNNGVVSCECCTPGKQVDSGEIDTVEPVVVSKVWADLQPCKCHHSRALCEQTEMNSNYLFQNSDSVNNHFLPLIFGLKTVLYTLERRCPELSAEDYVFAGHPA